ncbi:MAG TPA: hypothetical protein PK340_03265 [Bacilli bacterium]|nr:hypothetical protein [Bacilli bacterium]
MKYSNKDRLQMVNDHIEDGMSLKELKEKYHIDRVGRGAYKRDTKLLAIGRVKAGESIRTVALDLGLIDPNILGDWVRMYDMKEPDAIKDTFPRNNYMLKDERFKHKLDRELLEENERLRGD